MLCRFDYIEGEGLIELAGYLDLEYNLAAGKRRS